MVKRVTISEDKFRISAPGIDVDSAGDYQFIMHEDYLSSQPYFSKWVPCPFAGAGHGNYDANVEVTVPSGISDPFILLVPVGVSGKNYYPVNISYSGVSNSDSWTCYYSGTVPSIIVHFSKIGSSAAPTGAWMMLMRR